MNLNHHDMCMWSNMFNGRTVSLYLLEETTMFPRMTVTAAVALIGSEWIDPDCSIWKILFNGVSVKVTPRGFELVTQQSQYNTDAATDVSKRDHLRVDWICLYSYSWSSSLSLPLVGFKRTPKRCLWHVLQSSYDTKLHDMTWMCCPSETFTNMFYCTNNVCLISTFICSFYAKLHN